MDITATLTKVESAIATLTALKDELVRQAKPCRLTFVNFFPGGKSYAYTADESIAEGDIVMVPTASRGNIPGIVVYAENYTEDTVPFHGTKTVIGKLAEQAISPADLIRMTTELAPAVADKEASKSRLLAFLERRARQDAGVPDASEEDDSVVSAGWDDSEAEGDGTIPEPADGEPETTVTDSGATPF